LNLNKIHIPHPFQGYQIEVMILTRTRIDALEVLKKFLIANLLKKITLNVIQIFLSKINFKIVRIKDIVIKG
jgi:hypothetical protein